MELTDDEDDATLQEESEDTQTAQSVSVWKLTKQLFWNCFPSRQSISNV